MKKEIISRQAIRQVLKDYWREYRRHPLNSLIGFLAPALGTILIFFIPPLVIGRMIDVFSAGNPVTLRAAGWYIVVFGVSWMLGEVLWRIGEHFIIRVKERGIANLNQTAFQRILSKDYMFFTNTFVGSLTKKSFSFSYGLEAVTDLLNHNIFSNLFPVIFAAIVLWGYSPWIPLVLLGSFVIAVICVVPLVRARARLVDIRHEASSRVAGLLSDAVTNLFAVKSFARERAEYQEYEKATNDYGEKYRIAADFTNKRIHMVVSPLYVAVNIVGLIMALLFAERLGLQPGSMVVIFSYFSTITRMMWAINHVYRGFESAVGEAAEFTQMFITPPAVVDAPDATELRVTDAAVSFKNVSFGYREVKSGKGFLHGFNLEIPKYQKVGLVGPSGSGKTTITKLVLRFLDIQSGSIEIDGQDISKVTQESLRSAISYVPQEPLLFHRTLRENIAYGVDHASDREVVEAAKLAHAHEFITRLSKGYHTMVGERGVKLSGGQRQRVAIARAILKNSPILVLDEATSSLDSESEKYIQEGLAELMKGKTALVIAHRLSTIRNLDRILVLDKGRIVQDGTHDELIRQEGLYAKLWSHQSGEFLE